MYESGRFKKNCIWNYEKGSATKAWVNAQGFKNYIINSGRGSYIAKGSYEEVDSVLKSIEYDCSRLTEIPIMQVYQGELEKYEQYFDSNIFM